MDTANSFFTSTDEEVEFEKKVGPKINIDVKGVTYE